MIGIFSRPTFLAEPRPDPWRKKGGVYVEEVSGYEPVAFGLLALVGLGLFAIMRSSSKRARSIRLL